MAPLIDPVYQIQPPAFVRDTLPLQPGSSQAGRHGLMARIGSFLLRAALHRSWKTQTDRVGSIQQLSSLLEALQLLLFLELHLEM